MAKEEETSGAVASEPRLLSKVSVLLNQLFLENCSNAIAVRGHKR
jgi:hypothetical protein